MENTKVIPENTKEIPENTKEIPENTKEIGPFLFLRNELLTTLEL